ncbi:MAG TPA: hypothetical protein DCG47_11310 [Spirochaetaceae bacterium]|jgi:hypothetical protein|nr:hypothetical protein [Spirochaetaceae bacterium]
MGSDPATLGAAGLLTALAALFFTASVVSLAFFGIKKLRFLIAKERCAPPRMGLSFLFVCLSLGAGFCAWALVIMGRGAINPDRLYAYAVCGAAMGLAFGLFPRTSGSLLAVLALSSLALAWMESAAWHASLPGLEVARLSVYEANDSSSFVGLSAPDRNALPVVQNLRLPPGELRFEAELLSVRGPLAAFIGTGFHRLTGLRAGAERVALPVEPGPLHEPSFLAFLAPLLGLSREPFLSQGIAAVEFARARLRIGLEPGFVLSFD